MILQARTARPAIILNGQDFFNTLAPYFISLEYVDNCDGEKADDLSIELADRDRHFINEWAPDKGAFIDVAIHAERWYSLISPMLSLDCGRFWIDSLEFEMPDNKVTIKASSLPTNVGLKATDEAVHWQGKTLHELAQAIAKDNKMDGGPNHDGVDWQAGANNPRFPDVEQDGESALAFLQKQAKKAKLSIKVHRNTIVIFDEQAYEALPAKFTILYGNGPEIAGVPCYRIGSGTLETKLVDSATKTRLKHNSLQTGKVTTEEWRMKNEQSGPPGGSTGTSVPPAEPRFDAQGNVIPQTDDEIIQNIQENTDSENAAEQAEGGEGPILRNTLWNREDASASGQLLAKATLRDLNKEKWTGSLELALGNPLIAAGQTCNLSGFGQYDGKYFVVSAAHKCGPTFTTTINVRRVITDY